MGDKEEEDDRREDGYSDIGEEESKKGSQVEDDADLKARTSEKHNFCSLCYFNDKQNN